MWAADSSNDERETIMNTNGEAGIVKNAVAVDEIIFKNKADLHWEKMRELCHPLLERRLRN